MELRQGKQENFSFKTLREDHLRCQQRRHEILDQTLPHWRDLPETYLKTLKVSGIGGISDFTQIKCLHLQYAFHLAMGGSVGRYLDEHFQLNRFV